MSSSKHHLVIEDCNKLAPTNAVNHNQFIFTYIAKIKLINTNVPATPLTILFFTLHKLIMVAKLIERTSILRNICYLKN